MRVIYGQASRLLVSLGSGCRTDLNQRSLAPDAGISCEVAAPSAPCSIRFGGPELVMVIRSDLKPGSQKRVKVKFFHARAEVPVRIQFFF